MNQGLDDLSKALADIQREPQEGQAPTGQSGVSDPSRQDSTDPLASVKLDDIAKHPVLGKELQSLVDQRLATQMKGRTVAVRRQLEQELRPQIERQVRDEALRDHFSSLSQEEIVREITEDKDLAADYARLQAADRPMTAADLDYRVKVETYKQRIVEVSELLTNSTLPQDIRDKLSPDNYDFASRGDEGLLAWDNDVRRAIFAHEASTSAEAKRQEELAKQDESNPDYTQASIAGGRREKPPADGVFRTPDGKVDTKASLEYILSTQR